MSIMKKLRMDFVICKTVCLIFFLVVIHNGLGGNLMEPLPCHTSHDTANLADSAQVIEFDNKFQELYALLNKEAEYDEPCNVSLPNEDGRDIEIIPALERLEQHLENYQRGLWGYCAKEGAAELLKNIQIFIKRINRDTMDGSKITICNREKLLECHSKFNRCRCLVSRRNFRTIAAVWYNNTEESLIDPRRDLIKSQCILTKGSDCPVNSRFFCIPGTNCLFKNTKKPCVSQNFWTDKAGPDKVDSWNRVEGRHTLRGSAALSTGAPNVKERAGSDTDNLKESAPAENNEETTDSTATEVTPTNTGKYTILMHDYPSYHCYCVGFEGKSFSANSASTLNDLSRLRWIIVLAISIFI